YQLRDDRPRYGRLRGRPDHRAQRSGTSAASRGRCSNPRRDGSGRCRHPATVIEMRGIRIPIVAALVCSIFAGAAAYGQSTAQVSGAVKDQTGAVLPGTEVTMTQTETGLTRTTVTDETGSYSLPNLPIGPYRLEASLPGFRSHAQSGIVLQVNSNPVINVILQVGQVSDEVEVQANATLVETRSTAVGQVMENVRILELPLNGRQVTDLIVLSGAAVGGG